MKNFEKEELKKISYNCRKATFLIEKKQITKITLQEEAELKIHLVGCSICAMFMKQSILLNKMIHNLFNRNHAELKLDTKFKKKLQQQIEDHINNDRAY
ncbi:hypothetical protein [Pedobacter antarcticus]|uniref:hypothetical protein n=1 Tax=Pedobacter antarcticus TaxID=34086 RepID=UPI00292FA0BF|nr:hypothetical protein [Pedobacter antarcticus]